MDEKIIWLNRFHTQDKVELFKALKDKFGDEVVAVIESVGAERARREWRMRAQQHGSHTIDDLLDLLWEPLKAKGFEFTTEKRNEGVQMRCTRCPIYDLAKDIGGTDWLFHHTCNADPAIAEGFNPNIGLKRTKTLMQGDDYCDHFYFIKR